MGLGVDNGDSAYRLGVAGASKLKLWLTMVIRLIGWVLLGLASLAEGGYFRYEDMKI